MAKYLFLIQHEMGAYEGRSPDEMQNTGRTLRRNKDQGRLTVSDGPYVEGKELVAGFYLVEARDYEHAVELARDCPVLDRGILELREIVGG
jgi:hypothetical protein